MSHDDSSRFMRASSRSKRISLISLSAGGGCDDVLLFFRDRSNEQRGGGGDLNVRRNVSSPRAESSVKIGVEKYGDPAAALGPN